MHDDFDVLLSVYTKKRISGLLSQINFWNRRFLKSVNSKKNQLNNLGCINSLSCFYGWMRHDRDIVFFSSVEFVCSFEDGDGRYFQYDCYPKSTYLIYTAGHQLNIIIYDLKIMISVQNGSAPEVRHCSVDNNILSRIYLHSQGKLKMNV
jgi:hypothetical protein